MGLVNGLLSSFLAKQMNAARLLRYFQSQGLIDSFIFFRGNPGQFHVQVIMEVKEDKVDQFLELKSAGFIYNELLREVDIFYLIEDWESEGDLGADTAGDHVMGFFTEMGTIWGETELGTDKAITLTVKTMKGVTFNE